MVAQNNSELEKYWDLVLSFLEKKLMHQSLPFSDHNRAVSGPDSENFSLVRSGSNTSVGRGSLMIFISNLVKQKLNLT